MGRVLKFRAWEVDAEKMHHWDFFEWNMIDNNETTYEVMQFTGLTDRHGKEIYEGDVVKHFPLVEDDDQRINPAAWVVDAVVFAKGTFRLQRSRQWKDGTHDWYSIENLYTNDLEVLGNIYESPELLT